MEDIDKTDIEKFEANIIRELSEIIESSGMNIAFKIEGNNLLIEESKFPDIFWMAAPEEIRQNEELYRASFDAAQKELDTEDEAERGVIFDGKVFIKESAFNWGLIVFGILGLAWMIAGLNPSDFLAGIIGYGSIQVKRFKGIEKRVTTTICAWKKIHHGAPPDFATLHELLLKSKQEDISEEELRKFLRGMESEGILKRINIEPVIYDIA